MRERLEVAVILRAAQLQGGMLPLARTLRVSLNELQCWAQASTSIPDEHFLRLLDLIADATLREIDEASTTESGHSSRAGSAAAD